VINFDATRNNSEIKHSLELFIFHIQQLLPMYLVLCVHEPAFSTADPHHNPFALK
jgi:hypothetical protein